MRLERRALVRNLLAASTALTPLSSIADSASIPTYSLKGIPGLSSLTGADAPRPAELGVIGLGTNKDKTGRLNQCGKKGCVSSFELVEELYVPPWTYDSEMATAAESSFDSRKAALKAAAIAEREAAEAAALREKGEDAAAAALLEKQEQRKKGKSVDSARAELVAAIEAAEGRVIKAEDRYVYSEFTDPLTGVVDDVEFLFSKDSPLVNYRSAARSGGDDKRQRNRVRDLRKSLKPQGWKSVGRLQID